MAVVGMAAIPLGAHKAGAHMPAARSVDVLSVVTKSGVALSMG
jgi:hypothetical protein